MLSRKMQDIAIKRLEESFRIDYIESGMTKGKELDYTVNAVLDTFSEEEMPVNLPRWSLGKCQCCGKEIFMESFLNSLLLVELGNPISSKCHRNPACNPRHLMDVVVDCPHRLEITSQSKVISKVLIRKLNEFGKVIIQKDVLFEMALNMIGMKVGRRMFADAHGKRYEISVQ